MKTRSVLWTLLIALPTLWSGAWAAEDEESAGNNLSFPVIWSDGVALGLRGVFDAPVL